MNEAEAFRLAAVLDDATVREMESFIDDLPARLAKLESMGASTPELAATHLREEMERESSRACTLILAQPPRQLLAYVWSMRFMNVLGEKEEQGEGYRPNVAMVNEMQFLLEYVHAVWSCNVRLTGEESELDEAGVAELFDSLDNLRRTTLLYCLMKSISIAAAKGDKRSGELSMRVMMAWVNLRGRRYQVLEKEFLQFVLQPHDEALRQSYGMGAKAIAAGVQAIANSMRAGLSGATERIDRLQDTGRPLDDPEGHNGPERVAQVRDALDDLFNGGICNLSQHTDLTQPLLQDLSFSPGGNSEFLGAGEFKGTPMRTMPALVHPCIKLGNEYYATDGQFVRDVAYRTIQRGLLRRDPGYREEWNRRQKHLIEEGLTTIFASQLAGASVYRSVFFREQGAGDWAETDLVIVMEDVLLIVEAKAGVMSMHSPATDFDRHLDMVGRLIVDAHRQCKRFGDYLASANEVPIYELRDGKHIEAARLRLADFRMVVPIGLTVESLLPFSACVNSLHEIPPLLGNHGFMSMSVDDLLVINRFLRTTGELLHYFEVRQQASNVPDTTLLDETEYLGAYILRNRFDVDLREQRATARSVVWNAFAGIVNRYFEGENAGKGPVPRQTYPAELAAVLTILDKKRPKVWLEMDSAIRNLSGEERDSLSNTIATLKGSFGPHGYQSMVLFNGMAIQVWVCREGIVPAEVQLRRRAEVACIMAQADRTRVLLLSYSNERRLTSAECLSYDCPDPSREDYMDLQREAAALRMRALQRGDSVPRGA